MNEGWWFLGILGAVVVLAYSNQPGTQGSGNPTITSDVTNEGATITATYPGANSTQVGG